MRIWFLLAIKEKLRLSLKAPVSDKNKDVSKRQQTNLKDPTVQTTIAAT